MKKSGQERGLAGLMVVLGMILLAGMLTGAYVMTHYGLYNSDGSRMSAGDAFDYTFLDKPPTPTPDLTRDWMTYPSKINHYVIRVPQGWRVDDSVGSFINSSGEVVFTPPAGLSLDRTTAKVTVVALTSPNTRYPLNSRDQFTQWLNEPASPSASERIFKLANAQLDGLEAVEYVSRSLPTDNGAQYYNIVTWLQKDSINYYIELSGTLDQVNQIRDTYEQILTTFRFAN
ncbi:hypothetical protein M1563_01415 [Patescibacteria group bacterium]|nr:hypothetical protein [Patescibacteria group bacterium]